MRANALLPRGGGLALWSRRTAVALEEMADRVVAHGVPEIGQGTHTAVVAPGAMLLRHTYDSGLKLRSHLRASKNFALLGAVTLVGHELTGSAQNRIGCDDLATSLRACLLSFWPTSARGVHSPSVNRTRPTIW